MEPFNKKRLTSEMLFIKRQIHSLNLQNDTDFLGNSYLPILYKLNFIKPKLEVITYKIINEEAKNKKKSKDTKDTKKTKIQGELSYNCYCEKKYIEVDRQPLS